MAVVLHQPALLGLVEQHRGGGAQGARQQVGGGLGQGGHGQQQLLEVGVETRQASLHDLLQARREHQRGRRRAVHGQLARQLQRVEEVAAGRLVHALERAQGQRPVGALAHHVPQRARVQRREAPDVHPLGVAKAQLAGRSCAGAVRVPRGHQPDGPGQPARAELQHAPAGAIEPLEAVDRDDHGLPQRPASRAPTARRWPRRADRHRADGSRRAGRRPARRAAGAAGRPPRRCRFGPADLPARRRRGADATRSRRTRAPARRVCVRPPRPRARGLSCRCRGRPRAPGPRARPPASRGSRRWRPARRCVL